MGTENSLKARIKERLSARRQELDAVESQIASLTVRRDGIAASIAEDENLLAAPTPHGARNRKSATEAGSATNGEA